MQRSVLLRRTGASAAAVAIAVTAAACGGGDDAATPTGAPTTGTSQPATRPQTLTGGRTLLSIDATARRALDRLGVRIEPIGAASRTGTRLAFPISTGRVTFTPLAGRIEHRGGIRVRVAGAQVDATNLVIRPGQGVITAEVAGRRVPVFAIEAGQPRSLPGGREVEFPASVSLTPSAVPGLDDGPAGALLGDGLRVGTLRVAATT